MAEKNQNRKKFWLRVASVVMSILLWFYVVNQGDVAAGRDLMEVELKYHNLPADLTVSGPQTVSVRLWGSFHGSSNIVAFVDLSGMSKGVYKVPVKIESVKGAMFTSVQPDKVEVTLEELSEKTIQVKEEVKQNPQTGYQLTEVMLTPDHCIVKGDADAVGKVARVVAPIDLSNVKDVASAKVNLQARDANGKIISDGIKILPSVIDTYVVVEKKQITKKVNIKPQFSGKNPDGFTTGDVKTDPLQVSILGEQTRIDALNEISTKPIDISDKQADFVQIIDLIVPEGVIVVPSKVTINVKINKTADKGVH